MSDKKTQALKLALEALNKCDAALAEELSAWDIDPPLHHVLEASNACGPAITAIREALAEQPAQQEPVAWANPGDLQNFDMKVRTNGGPLHTVPLYTSPPASKPWVGLTQQDIDIAFDDTQEGGGFNEFARAIEAKLREKNT